MYSRLCIITFVAEKLVSVGSLRGAKRIKDSACFFAIFDFNRLNLNKV